MFDISFRKIKPSDKQEFIKMSADFYSSDAVLSNIAPSCHENTFNELMRSDDYLICYMFSDDSSGEIIGYSLLNRLFTHEAGGLTMWIEELYIKDAYRGRGVGGRFLDFVEKAHPAKRYRLETEPENAGAASLYNRHGYKKLDYMQMYKDFDV